MLSLFDLIPRAVTYLVFALEGNRGRLGGSGLTGATDSDPYKDHRLKRTIPGGSVGKESAYNAGELGSIPGLGRSPGEGNGYPLQYFCLENPMHRGACWATVHGLAELDTTEVA